MDYYPVNAVSIPDDLLQKFRDTKYHLRFSKKNKNPEIVQKILDFLTIDYSCLLLNPKRVDIFFWIRQIQRKKPIFE